MVTRRLVLSGLLTSCLPRQGLADAVPFRPDAREDGWPVAMAEEAGLDLEALRDLVETIDAGITVPNVHAVLIEHAGRLIFEHYWAGEDLTFDGPLGYVHHGPTTLHDIRSVTKSITSVLLGIALGSASRQALHRPITSFFPDHEAFGAGLETVTLHHVLTMTAGLPWNETVVPALSERNDFFRLMTAEDPVDFMLARDVDEPPASRWNYSSGLTELTAGLIEEFTQTPLEMFAQRVLFQPLGITHYTWLRPDAWPADHFPSASAGLRMRARDVAKIGSVVLHNGQWQGRQIVPADWITVSTARHVPNIPWGPPGGYGYGYFWSPGTLISGHKVVRASGYGDQRVFVLPDDGLVVTVFAGNYDDPSWGVGERIMHRIARMLS